MTSAASQAWDTLSNELAPTRGEFRVLASVVSSIEGPALYALDSAGLRHLLIPVRAEAIVEADQRSNGVHILGRTLVDGDRTYNFLDVVCRKAHLAEVFAHLVDEVLNALPTDPGRPSSVARRVLNRWRELLEREQPGVLTEEELLGIFGELWILVELATRNPAAIRSWTGPLGARFDFQRQTVALEVKTTTSRDRATIHIHGVDQLEPPEGGELYLNVLSAERADGAGVSVPSLVSRLRGLGVDPVELTTKLHGTGYSEHDAGLYADLSWRVLTSRLFRIDEDFPRINRASFVGGELPPGVSNLRYCVDVASPPPTPRPPEEVVTLVARLIPG